MLMGTVFRYINVKSFLEVVTTMMYILVMPDKH